VFFFLVYNCTNIENLNLDTMIFHQPSIEGPQGLKEFPNNTLVGNNLKGLAF